MDAAAFVEKWRKSNRSERSASQEHFLDLCELFGHPKPGAVDAKGETFTAERMVKKASGGRGFADFFKKGFFGWEYKKKGADLNEAFNQLLQYSGDLGNPPLLVASDMDRVEIRTHFTGFPTTFHVITLDDFTKAPSLDKLRRVFFDPESFRPEKTIEKITEEAAVQLAEIAPTIRARYPDPTRVAHFLDRLIFCLFAEDVGLLPEKLFSRVVEEYETRDSRKITKDIGQLFEAMAHGGDFYGKTIRHFDGNLFDDSPPLELNALEIEVIHRAAALDWSEMDPSIFGTLFERVMDPDQRSQLGAHYTGFTDIATLVEPVVMAPLRREWEACRERVDSLIPPAPEPSVAPSLFPAADPSRRAEAQTLIDAFLKRLRAVRVLDPACGSGNFLYVSLRMMKELEYDVLVFSRHHDLKDFALEVGPHQLRGIEVNPYAHDLAQMTVWIGYLQWNRSRGFPNTRDPVLQPLDTIERKDAILDLTNPDFPREPDWPEADFIVGNPPFLGNKRMKSELGADYCAALWKLYGDRIPAMSDLCCYWFEKARAQLALGKGDSAGLLATTGIKQVGARRVLERITDTCRIFFAVSDRDWILDGATLRICMVGFSSSHQEKPAVLDGIEVKDIHADLKAGIDLSGKRRLGENVGHCFMGMTKVGKFDIEQHQAVKMLADANPHGRPNSDVLRPFRNGSDLVQKCSYRWVIDFGVSMAEHEASLYKGPFEHLLKFVKPMRQNNGRAAYREKWWIHGESRPGFRRAVSGLSRYIATARVAKHRIFTWLDSVVLPDSKIIAITFEDDMNFGVLHSRIHEIWSLACCGWHGGERGTYNPTTCFETFPFPKPTVFQREAVSKAAKRLDELRSNDLIPPEWHREELLEFPGAVDGPWRRFVHEPNAKGIGTVRYPRLVPKDTHFFDVAKRTLTNLYNDRPTWLDLAHRALDDAVFAAYGWKPSMSDDEILAALLELNLERSDGGGTEPTGGVDKGESEEDT